MIVVAYSVRSGIVALNVVTAALDTDPRTRDVQIVFARNRDEVARAIVNDTAIVAWSFYSPDATRAFEDLAWLRAHASSSPGALHVAGGVHATAETAATLVGGFDIVVAGEGEAPFIELVAAVAEDRDPRGGPGTACLRDGAVLAGPAAPRRPLDDYPACNLAMAGGTHWRSRAAASMPARSARRRSCSRHASDTAASATFAATSARWSPEERSDDLRTMIPADRATCATCRRRRCRTARPTRR